MDTSGASIACGTILLASFLLFLGIHGLLLPEVKPVSVALHFAGALGFTLLTILTIALDVTKE